MVPPSLSFSKKNKQGTLQPHDDALVVIVKIRDYDVRRVLVDQESRAEIMYLDLYRGLNLRTVNLDTYDSPLMSFDGKMVVPRGMIRLPVQVSDIWRSRLISE